MPAFREVIRTFRRSAAECPGVFAAENGAVVYEPRTRRETLLASPPPLVFVERLKALGVPLDIGQVVVATWLPHHNAVLQAAAAMRGPSQAGVAEKILLFPARLLRVVSYNRPQSLSEILRSVVSSGFTPGAGAGSALAPRRGGCHRHLAGSGSLTLAPEISGKSHYDPLHGHIEPFCVGKIDALPGHLHVFDDLTLPLILKEGKRASVPWSAESRRWPAGAGDGRRRRYRGSGNGMCLVGARSATSRSRKPIAADQMRESNGRRRTFFNYHLRVVGGLRSADGQVVTGLGFGLATSVLGLMPESWERRVMYAYNTSVQHSAAMIACRFCSLPQSFNC